MRVARVLLRHAETLRDLAETWRRHSRPRLATIAALHADMCEAAALRKYIGEARLDNPRGDLESS